MPLISPSAPETQCEGAAAPKLRPWQTSPSLPGAELSLREPVPGGARCTERPHPPPPPWPSPSQRWEQLLSPHGRGLVAISTHLTVTAGAHQPDSCRRLETRGKDAFPAVQDQLPLGSTPHAALEASAGDGQGKEESIWVKSQGDKGLEPGRSEVDCGWGRRRFR